MTTLPNLLGIYFDLYGKTSNMPFSKALMVSVVGFITVIIVLAVIALFIKLIAFIFSLAQKKKKIETPIQFESDNTTEISPQRSQVELIDVDEETAAVIMALVSHNSGIDLDRLDFKSIKLMEDK